MEIWKDIKGYEGKYQISNYGNVKSLKTNKNLYYSNSTKGYLRVGLYKEQKRKMFSIHRLVAEHFLSNEKNKPCVNHKDCNVLNNNVNNLEWCTYKENNLHSYHNLKKYISLTLHNLKKEMPNEEELINILTNFKNKL